MICEEKIVIRLFRQNERRSLFAYPVNIYSFCATFDSSLTVSLFDHVSRNCNIMWEWEKVAILSVLHLLFLYLIVFLVIVLLCGSGKKLRCLLSYKARVIMTGFSSMLVFFGKSA